MKENKLREYRTKRDFSVTKEPRGKTGRPRKKKLRFSVQHHVARADHYDLRLEWDGVALSWAVPKGPSFCVSDKRLAVRVEDHPVEYMQFEGTIPKGEYGGGTVMLWDEGEWLPRVDPERGLREGSLKFSLFGSRLKGDWALVRMKADDLSEPWLLIKEKDEYAKKTAGIGKFSRGVRSGKSMKEIGSSESNPFQSAEVMLARACAELPKGKGWIFELKYDGYRTLAFSEKGKTRLQTRNGMDCTNSFPGIARAVSELLRGRAAVLDGETVAAGEGGIPDFGKLQACAKRGKGEVKYVLFDILSLDGVDLREMPLIERKQKLEALFKDAPSVLSYSTHTDKMTKAGIEAIRTRGIEGIVAKRADGKYVAGKNGDWQKLKFRNGQEFVIGGYTLSESGAVKALLVGFYERGKLKFAGRVGTGFSDEARRELKEELCKLIRKRSPFFALPKEEKEEGTVWVEPLLAAQVEYAERTSSGRLRQASFKGIRKDKPASEITLETENSDPSEQAAPTFCGICITHPEKIMFPNALTKSDLAQYYAGIAERMLPYLKDRPMSVVCCPAGIMGEKFFRKHPGEGFEVKRVGEDYFCVTGKRGLLSLVQSNAVEFHIRGDRRTSLGRPDVMVFDLDPDEGLPLSKVRRGARALKEVLDELRLVSFLKTSGGKGYHIVVPFRSGADGEAFRNFAEQVAKYLEKAHPDKFVSTMSKRARKGKIFLDWQRNTAGATSVAPYSVRAREGAPISMPIAWEELEEVAPNSVTVESVLSSLEKDPWKDYFSVKSRQSLKGTG